MANRENEIDEEIFNWQELLNRTLEDEEFARELLGEFINRFPDQLKTLKEAVDNKDFESAAKLAHTIKGSSINLSIGALSLVALEVEKAGKSKNSVSASDLIDDLEKEFEKFKDVLVKY